MNVKNIIDRFGGQTALAKLVGKNQSTVGYWAKSGVIPAKWHSLLLDLAMRSGVSLSPYDFVSTTYSESTIARPVPRQDNDISIKTTSQEPDGLTSSPFLFYSGDNGSTKVQVMVGGETVWASQKGMAEIFDVEPNTINYHLKEIFGAKELEEQTVTRIFRVTAVDGKNYATKFFNLDAIISVGYRVNSVYATRFRQWATQLLKSYLIKGFVIDEDRLKQGKQLFGKDYFDELLEKIREIRASERRFYQKITDIYAQCSIDYDKDSTVTQQFYAHVQDKLHYAVHGNTSAELIKLRADSTRPYMGLSTWNNQGKGGKILKTDVIVGKNYLTATEMTDLNRLVSMYLDWAENLARRQIPMKMMDWIKKLDGFLQFNAYVVLNNSGGVQRSNAERAAVAEYEKFRILQDAEYRSDFDNVVDGLKAKQRLSKTDE